MRQRRRGAGTGAAHLQKHHRLARGACALQGAAQRIAIAQTFGAGRDDLHIGATCHPFDALGNLDITLVAGGDEVAHLHAAAARQISDVCSISTALADHADRSGLWTLQFDGTGEGRVHVQRGVVDAQAVRSDDAHAAVTRNRGNCLLTTQACVAHLRKAGTEHHRGADTLRRTFGQRRQHRGGWHRHHRQIDRPRCIGNVRQRCDALHRLAARINRIQRTAKAALQQIVQGPAADAGGVVRRTNDGHRAWRHQGIESGWGGRRVFRRVSHRINCPYSHTA